MTLTPVTKKSKFFTKKVYQLVSKIPEGKVTTYGYLAKLVNINPRQVGHILHLNPDPQKIHCHRVVSARGGVSNNFAFGGPAKQRQLLIREKVKFKGNKVDLNFCLWSG